MKPINLKIKGINSYVTEQEVCFDKLSETNLFGIFGETGSGKTTILDAIVIALYGTSDRETIANLINVNTKDAYIIFEFEIAWEDKPTRYVVTRTYKARKSGVKSEALLVEKATGKVIADMTDKVNEALLKIIGFGKKEFTKCIALPQGEFDAFLLDTPANRKKTVAKLFNIEHFGAMLNDKLKRHKDMLTLNKLNTQDKIAMYGDVNDEVIAILNNQLKDTKKELTQITKSLEKDKKEYEVMLEDYQNNEKLIDAMAQLTVMKGDQEEINYCKKQVEFTQKYGDYLLYYNKKEVCEKSIKELKEELKADQSSLIKYNNEYDKVLKNISIVQDKNREIEEKINASKEKLMEYNRLDNLLKNAIDKKNRSVLEINQLLLGIKQIKNDLAEYRKTLDVEKMHYKALEKSIFDNMDILDKINECKNCQTQESFLDYLSHIKTIITTDSLEEVRQYNVYDEIMDMHKSIDDYDNFTRKSIAGLKNDLDTFNNLGGIDKIQSELERKNVALNKECDKIEDLLEDAKKRIIISETQIAEKQSQLTAFKNETLESDIEVKELKIQIKELGDVKSLKLFEAAYKKNNELIAEFEQEKTRIIEERNTLNVNIEVNLVQIENFEETLKEVKKNIKGLNIKTVNDNIEDVNLHLSPEELKQTQDKIAKYEETLLTQKAIIDQLKSVCKNTGITKQVIDSVSKNIKDKEAREKELSIKQAVDKAELDTLKANLVRVKALNKEYDEVKAQLDTALELQSLIQNGSLLDYVSEEYMYLITDFSNKYVYNISKGKFLLKYDGEFYVIDNFNGGVVRGVKTLSGGERFIISLSIALGISQSIAINNNRPFNFFFIDEGFGSLSEGYIENVLESFDSLISLNFTVGFISHVEKMQEFINNRIIVTKHNNEEGSIIKQYY